MYQYRNKSAKHPKIVSSDHICLVFYGVTLFGLLKYTPFKFIKMNSWRNSKSPLSSYAMPNSWFKKLGLYQIEKMLTGWLAPSAFVKTR